MNSAQSGPPSVPMNWGQKAISVTGFDVKADNAGPASY